MERRKHNRVAVNLNAALVSDRVLPIGCRVRNVSVDGMMLEYYSDGTTTSLNHNDSVEVRVSLKQNTERKVIHLPMTVRRSEEDGIAAEFPESQPQLMSLVEPYRLDKEFQAPDPAETSTADMASPILEDSVESSSAQESKTRDQLEDSMDTAPEHSSEVITPARIDLSGDIGARYHRTLFYIGVASLILAVGILILSFADRLRLENRLRALESTNDLSTKAIPLISSLNDLMDRSAKELTQLNDRIDTLDTLITAETQTTQDAISPVTAETQTSQDAISPVTAETQTTQDAISPVGTGGTSLEGSWVINLLTLYDKTAANKFTEQARALGVRADTKEETVQGQQVWRIQVSGFPSREEATAYGETSKEKLDLSSVWIFSED
jgi:cell division septation protein DedD